MLKNYMQRASKWHTHSPYLQLETLRVQKSLSGNSYYKTQTINNSTRKPSCVEESCRIESFVTFCKIQVS